MGARKYSDAKVTPRTGHNRVELMLRADTVGALRRRIPITIRPTATIRDAIQTMLSHNLGSLLVVGMDGKLLGIFSERDLLIKVAGLHEPYAELPVAQFMTPDPETGTPEDTLAFAVHKMY